MEDKKKKFTIPEAEIIVFNNDDIIVTSSMTEGTDGAWGSQDGEGW